MSDSVRNPLNIYRGPDALRQYYDPDQQPILPLVEVPQCLNPLYGDGVRIYAKMMTMLPAHNVKALPARQLLESSVVQGQTKEIIEYSSGSTVISMAILAQVNHGIDNVRAFLSNKTSMSKLRLMQFFGLDITLFGGPSQPTPDDKRGGIHAAAESAKGASTVNPNQYDNEANWKSHVRYTGPQILKQLPEVNIVCCGMGTSGTMTGVGTYFKQAKPSVHRLGVCTAPGDRVPGPRSYALMSPVQFPWRDAIDSLEEVGSADSFRLSLELCRQGIVCGPSSGFNLQGLHQFLQKRKEAEGLTSLAGPDGLVHCVSICCDLPYQYIDEYFDKLGESAFAAIQNRNLVGVDTYRYEDSWELNLTDAISLFYSVSPSTLAMDSSSLVQGTLVLDFRQTDAFHKWHLPDSRNLPLGCLYEGADSPFADSNLLRKLWLELDSLLGEDKVKLLNLLAPQASSGSNVKVLCLCYDGDTSRIATSVLRARGVEAWSIAGGSKAVDAWAEAEKVVLSERLRNLASSARLDSQKQAESPDAAVACSKSVEPLLAHVLGSRQAFSV